jgi:hypothetical protein
MLASYAYAPVYLNVARLHGRCLGDGVQVGGRQRCGSLQRSAPRKCPEGGAEGAADLFRSKDLFDTGTILPELGTQACAGVPELLSVGPDERSGVHEHIRGNCWSVSRAGGATRRLGRRHSRRAARAGCAGERRTIRDFASGSRHAYHPDGGEGSVRRHSLLVGVRDVPCSPAVRAVTHESRPTALKIVRGPPRARAFCFPWRAAMPRGRRGR